jgi:hypothetical protein
VERQKIIHNVEVEKTDEKFSIIATTQEWNELAQQYDTTGKSMYTQTSDAISTEVSRATGEESRIDQKADGIGLRVGTAEGKISSLELTVDGITLTSSGTITVGSTSFTALAASDVTISGNTVTIKGSDIYLSGAVDAVEAKIDNLTSGLAVATTLSTGQLIIGQSSFTPHNLSLASQIYIVASTANIDLAHSHSITFSESNGVVTGTIGGAQLSNGSHSFNIAATQFYLDAVAAAEASGWDAAYAKVVPPSQGTGTSFDVKVPDTTQGNQHTYTFTIQKGATPGSSGYASVALSGTVVGRISIGDWYDAGVTAGEAKYTPATVHLRGQQVLVTPVLTGSNVYCYQTEQVSVTTQGKKINVTLYDSNGDPYNVNGINIYREGSTETYYTRSNGAYRYKADSPTFYYMDGGTVTDTYYTKNS